MNKSTPLSASAWTELVSLYDVMASQLHSLAVVYTDSSGAVRTEVPGLDVGGGRDEDAHPELAHRLAALQNAGALWIGRDYKCAEYGCGFGCD